MPQAETQQGENEVGRQISRSDLGAAVLKGIQDARRIHRKISRRRFGQAPESWIASILARRLAKASGCGIELEARVAEIMDAAGARTRGRIPAKLRHTGRFDIVVWWKSRDTPRALIEVKQRVRKGAIPSLVKDAKRILTALHRGSATSDLDWGCLAFYCHSSPRGSKDRKAARRELEETLRVLRDRVAQLDRDKAFVVRLHEERKMEEDSTKDDIRYGRACCISIRRNPSAG